MPDEVSVGDRAADGDSREMADRTRKNQTLALKTDVFAYEKVTRQVHSHGEAD